MTEGFLFPAGPAGNEELPVGTGGAAECGNAATVASQTHFFCCARVPTLRRGRWRAQPSATKERYGCGPPLAGAHRPACPDSPELPFLQLHCNCAFGDPLFLPCQKKWAKRGAGYESDCTAVPQNGSVEEYCGQHTRPFLQNYTTAPPAWRQRSHRKQLPRKEMAKYAAVEITGHLRIRRWCTILAFYCKHL